MFTDLYKSENVPLADSFGVSYPEVFSDAASEYRALTTTAGLIDLCHWGLLRLTGADRIRLFDALTTNDVRSLSPGRACHSALVSVKGKLAAELYVLLRDEELVVLVSQGDADEVARIIDKHIIADDVTCLDDSGEYGVVAVEGPTSSGVVWRLFPTVTLPEDPLHFVDTDYLGTPVTIVRSSVTGEPGYQLVVGAGAMGRIRRHLIQSGRADDAALVGRQAWNTRRVEAGIPWWGCDVVPGENFPKECRLDDVVSYTKGCFLGQETLARMHHRGHPNWLLSGVLPVGANPAEVPPVGSEMFAASDETKPVGRVTSAVFSPALEKPLIMGYVRTAFADPGTKLVLRAGQTDITVEVTSLPVK